MFNIIKTNRNKTATAPTQTTKKAIGKNSKLNKNSKAETLKKENIKKRTENIGFLVQITKIADVKQNAEKIINKLNFKNIVFVN